MAARRAKARASPSTSVGAAAPAHISDIVSPGEAPWALLLPIDQAHPILRFNPYILHGYRCNLRLWHCVRSMAFLHNETCNVASHFAALLYFAAVTCRLYSQGSYVILIQVRSSHLKPSLPPLPRPLLSPFNTGTGTQQPD